MSEPNVLNFMADQLASFVLKAYEGSFCKAPNLDEFATRGTVFENTYCPYPLCAPPRFAMMSGRLPSRIKAYEGAEIITNEYNVVFERKVSE